MIGGDIVVQIVKIVSTERVMLGISAPATVSVNRREVETLLNKIDAKEASK